MKFKVSITLLIIALISTSCRKEETQFEQAPEDEILEANSNVADLIERTTSNDGSEDNIVDRANCFDIAFPYVINVNDEQLTVNSEEDYALVECVFDQSDDDTDSLGIVFPVTIILADFTAITINDNAEFTSYTNSCNGENVTDNDIECIDFQYPLEASVFNPNNELLETLVLENDSQLFGFVKNIDENTIVTMDFPINVTLSDNTISSISNFIQLQNTIETAINSCDEDDDYDYNEDDCDECSVTEIENLLTDCSDWAVNTLRRDNNTNYDDIYYNYAFNFFNDGSLSVSWNTTTVSGTWSASGSGNSIEIDVDIPALPLCNNNWILREIKNCTNETEIDLRIGVDRLQYARNCN